MNEESFSRESLSIWTGNNKEAWLDSKRLNKCRTLLKCERKAQENSPNKDTCTSRGNPGFPASTRESPRETFFNTSRGQSPLPWLGSNDALPLATRMETRLPWRPTRGSLTSPSYLVRNRTLGPPLENNPEIPPSSREEGLRLLHGLATNLATSLQTPQEA